MGDVLSQSEIDALLNSVSMEGSQEEVAEEKKDGAVEYNFYSPKKFTKEKLRLINSVFEYFSRSLSAYFNSMLRISCEIQVEGMEEQRYYEVKNALYDEDIICFLSTKIPNDKPTRYPMMSFMSKPLVYTMIDRLLGGDGIYGFEDESEAYTDVEMAIYRDIVTQTLPIMVDAWGKYLSIELQLEKMDTNGNMDTTISLDDIVVIVSLNVSINDKNEKMNVFLSRTLLENTFQLLEQSKIKKKMYEEYQSDQDSKEILKGIKDTQLEMTAKLAEVQMQLADIYGLRVGDVIDLGKPTKEKISLCVQGDPWFTGTLGAYKTNMAVRVEQVYRKNDNSAIKE